MGDGSAREALAEAAGVRSAGWKASEDFLDAVGGAGDAVSCSRESGGGSKCVDLTEVGLAEEGEAVRCCEVSVCTVGAAGAALCEGLAIQLAREVEGAVRKSPFVLCRFPAGGRDPRVDVARFGDRSAREEAELDESSNSISMPSSASTSPSFELVLDPMVLLRSRTVVATLPTEALLSLLDRPNPSHILPLTVMPLAPLFPLRMLAPSSMSAMCRARREAAEPELELEVPETLREGRWLGVEGPKMESAVVEVTGGAGREAVARQLMVGVALRRE